MVSILEQESRSVRAKSRTAVQRSRDDTGAQGLGVARPGASTSLDTNGIWKVLGGVPDPEIPAVSIVDLGIVRTADSDRVVLTPTYTGCPATFAIEAMVRTALDKAGYRDVRIETTLSPPWTTDWISEEGRRKLLDYGIAPPTAAGNRTVECPQCGATDTEQVSRFGSTPCKALWRCRACLEPFDLFKCH
jgi:ring-1,2-phenylacetyl-CoA epoxidase subunit PaaD